MHFRKSVVATFAFCALACALSACTLASRPRLPTENLLTPAVIPTPLADGEVFPLSPPNALTGAGIYAEKCAACHGVTGEGNGPSAAQIKAQGQSVANLVDPSRRRAATPGEWHALITSGRIQNLMPGFSGSLNAQQRWDVQAHVWALGVPSQTLGVGGALFAEQCAACHGAQGETPVGAGAAQITLDSPRFLADRSLLDISSGMVRGEPHAAMTTLTEDQRFQIADYVRSLAYIYADPAEARDAQLSGDGQIILRALNGTPGGPAIANLPVLLRAYDENSEVLSRTANLDAAGVVTFTGLPRADNFFYQAELDYEDGRFYAAPTQLTISGTAVISGVLPAFETTTDPSGISIAEKHFFVQDIGEGTATIVEFSIFNNAGDRAYIGEPGPGGRRYTLKLSAPKDAQNLRFDGLGLGRRFFQEGDVIYDTDVVVPGQQAQQVTMIYEVPYRGSFDFSRPVYYPAARWDVLVPEITGPGTPLTVTGLTNRGLQQTPSGNLFLFASETPANAGDALAFQLSGQPLGAPQPGADPRAIGLGLIALGLAIGIGYFMASRVRAIRAAEARSRPQQRDMMLRQIAALDDDFAQAKIKEPAYRKQREALKDELKDIWE
jgi:mono/diheme cytochrome c family protein